MEMGSCCSDCLHCTQHYALCLAGHGDDDFTRVTKAQYDLLMFRDDKQLPPYKRKQLRENFPEHHNVSDVPDGSTFDSMFNLKE